MRWWDGKQWLGLQPPPRRNVARPLGIGIAVVLVLFFGFAILGGGDSNEPGEVTDSALSEVSTVPALPRSRTPTPPTPLPPVTLLPPAKSAGEAGCAEPDPSVINAIEGALTEGRVLRDLASVFTIVNGIQYEYVGANVFLDDGVTRSISGAVWLSPGLGVVNLSSNSRDATPGLAFGRGVYGNAGDDAGLKVQDCVSALARGR